MTLWHASHHTSGQTKRCGRLGTLALLAMLALTEHIFGSTENPYRGFHRCLIWCVEMDRNKRNTNLLDEWNRRVAVIREQAARLLREGIAKLKKNPPTNDRKS